MRLFRLGMRAYPVWDGTGAAIAGGRWNPPGSAVIYAASSLSLAMLEVLVQRRSFDGAVLVEAEAPDDLPFDDLLATPPRGWRDLGSPASVAAGRRWLTGGRTALLRVPSAIVPSEGNWVINPAHRDAARIIPATPTSLEWDARLFGIPAPVSRRRTRS